ncbi:hypothetical protein MNV49_004474 [Pseudohyphozyma bogoriensis]|nr:hypothetical protein MNV49_004474 [Pseudohyphozyma bogoriensis]
MVASQSASAPLFVVVGATGAQGGSVLTHLLKSKLEYRLRGLTRDPRKPSGQAWVAKGVEMVKGDLGDPATIDKAFEGADYVFAVTNFWEHASAEIEMREGKTLVDAALGAGVKLFVWSGLEAAYELSGGKYRHVSHFDSKAAITDYAKSTGIPLAVVKPGFYLTNLSPRMLTPNDDGSYALTLPAKASTRLPVLFTPEDFGAFVVEAVEGKSFGVGSEVLGAAEYISLEEIAKQWGEVTGTTITFQQTHPGPGGNQEIIDMWGFFSDFGYFGGKDIAPSHKELTSHVMGFKEFAEKQGWSTMFD